MENYLNIQIQNTLFNNCNTTEILQNCHYSCQQYDGPTQNNCLSCTAESQRIYLPESQACVYPFDTIDQEICLSYKDLNFKLFSEIMSKCNYGYFEFEDLSIYIVTCIECLQNPKGWSQNPYYQNDLFLNQNGDVESIEWHVYSTYYVYNWNELIQVDDYYKPPSFIVDDDYYVWNKIITLKTKYVFCPSNMSFCNNCLQTIYGKECVQCQSGHKLINGRCIKDLIDNIDINIENKSCDIPYYLTSKRKCSLCPIADCKYCFEYQENDLSKYTLYNNVIDLDSDIEAKMGCALCEDNFIFDFNDGNCQFKQPKQQNYLRSFVYEGQFHHHQQNYISYFFCLQKGQRLIHNIHNQVYDMIYHNLGI